MNIRSANGELDGMHQTVKFLESILHTSADGIVITDAAQNIILVNNEFCSFLGHRRCEVIETNLFVWLESFGINTIKQWLELEKSVRTRGGCYDVEFQRMTTRGSRYFSINASPIEQTSTRKYGGIISFWHDITERKRVEEELSKSEQNYRNIFENAMDGIVTASLKGNLVTFNNAFVELTGYSKEELPNMRYQDLTPPEYHDMEAEKAKILLETGESQEFEKEYIRKDGTRIPLLLKVSAIYDADGKPKLLMAVVKDMTRTKLAEEELRKLTHAVEQSSSTVVITDVKGNIEYVNPKFTQLTGYTAEEAMGQNPRILKTDKTPPEEYKRLWKNITSGSEWVGEFCNKKKNGELYWELASISPVKNDEGVITNFIAVKEDITERKQAEDELLKKNSHLKLLQVAAVAANEAVNIKDAFQPILKEVCCYTGWEIGHAYVVSKDDSDLLVPTEVWWLEDKRHFKDFCNVTKETKFAKRIGLPGRVLASGKPHWIVELARDKNFPRAGVAEKMGLKSGIAFPVMVGTDVRAVLEFYSTDRVEPDQQFMGIMADLGIMLGRTIERKQAEDEMSKSYHRNLLHTKRTPLAVIEWNTNFEVTEWNPAAEKIFGYRKDEALGRHAEFIVHENAKEHVYRMWRDLLAQKGGKRSTQENITKDGNAIICVWYNTPLVSESGDVLGVASLAQDVTKIKLVEETLKKYSNLLEDRVKERTEGLIRSNMKLQTEIIERKDAEYLLKENNELIQSIMDNTAAMIYLKDKEGKYILVNRQFETLFHSEKGEVIGKTVEDIFPEKIAKELNENDNKIFKFGGHLTQEETINQDDGPHTYLSTKFLLFDSNGVPDRICGISTDITERKAAEEALKESESKYRKLLETAKDAIICDINGTITVWNKSAEKLFGYLKDEIIGKPVEILIPEKYKKAHRRGLGNFIKTGVGNIVDKKRIEVSGLTKEGVVIPIEISLTAQRIGKEQYFFVSVIRDLTGQKKSAKALKASEHKYRTLVQTIPAIVYKIDTDGCFIYTNNSIRELGYEPEDLRGKHFSEIILHEDFSLCNRFDVLPRYANKVTGEKEMLKLFDERRTGARMTKDLEIRFVPKSWNRVEGEIPVMVGSVTSSGDYDDESEEFSGTVGIIMDITEKTKLLSESIRSSQLAAVGEMAAGVAHEINNPINTILNSAQLLLDESSDKDINYNDVNVIMEESAHIANIVRSLLSFVRDEKDERINSNVLSMVTEMLVLTGKQMKSSGIKIKVSISQNLPDVFVCRQQIQQVFLNILNNAQYALGEKHPGPHKDKVIEVSGKKTTINGTRYVQIIFRDRGIGISANKINKVMSPFYTTKPLNEGTGLGLSISDTIINEHNGKMVIESVQGQYTKVIISLPVKT